MKKIISIIVFTIILLAGCGGSKAENTALEFTQNLYKGNVKTLSSLIYVSKEDLAVKGTKEVIDGKLSMIVADAINKADKKGGFSGVKVISSEEKDDITDVTLEIKFKNGETRTEILSVLKNQDGKWKIRL